MLIDHLAHWNHYCGTPAWREAMTFVDALGPDAEPGAYPIRGADIHAVIFTYATLPRTERILEAHRRFTDIQVLLQGRERHERHAVAALAEKNAYDPERDVAFYHLPPQADMVFAMEPGLFAAYLPQDAHITQVTWDDAPCEVKKVVVKVRTDLLLP
ncbi:MAG: YhcH/YjgK/YiaL family protein [Desulfovibrionaceae bacterium]